MRECFVPAGGCWAAPRAHPPAGRARRLWQAWLTFLSAYGDVGRPCPLSLARRSLSASLPARPPWRLACTLPPPIFIIPFRALAGVRLLHGTSRGWRAAAEGAHDAGLCSLCRQHPPDTKSVSCPLLNEVTMATWDPTPGERGTRASWSQGRVGAVCDPGEGEIGDWSGRAGVLR